MTETVPTQPSIETTPADQKSFLRFSVDQRIEHLVFLISFSILGFTGMIQKFAQVSISQFFLSILGGIESVRIIHRFSAFVMMVVSIYHIVALLYRVFVKRVSWSMLPSLDDLKHLLYDLYYYFGMRRHKAYYGRYNYAEKAEYLAVVWGTIIMAITGFMMWNPIATTKFFPGEFIPASKAAHGAEAILAILAILLWHFYHVHIKKFNKSMFTGKLSREEMEEEHPAELAQIEAGTVDSPNPQVIKKRQRIYFPVASILVVVFGFGVYQFLTIEETAIMYVPPGESVAIFVPITPTPRPTPTPTPIPEPGAAPVVVNSWEGTYRALFNNRCGTCHGNTAVGGLSLRTYADALKGGNNGPAIVPGYPEASELVKIQLAGNHPGQLYQQEIDQIISWIEAGAVEK